MHSLRCPAVLLALALPVSAVIPPDPAGWQILFRDDFSGLLGTGWRIWSAVEDTGAGWAIRSEAGNGYFAGAGHATATYVERRWGDQRFSTRLRLQRGMARLLFHWSTCIGYIVTVETAGVSLSRSDSCNGREETLTGWGPGPPMNAWQQVDVVAAGARIQVYLGGARFIDYTDPAPIQFGNIALSSGPGASFDVDDLAVAGPPEAGFPSWVRTGGPLGGIGYDVRMAPNNPDLMYVTDSGGGVHVSTDGGGSWLPSNYGIASRTGPTGDGVPIFCLTVDPNNPAIIWAGTQNVRGIYKSTDGGKTWVSKDRGIVENSGISFRGFTVDPRDSRIVYAAAQLSSVAWAGRSIVGKRFDLSKGVVYKTTDGGQNWQAIWRGDCLARYVWIDPRDSRVLYVSTGFFDTEAANSDAAKNLPGGVGVLKSTDGGLTWETLNAKNGLLNLYVGSLFMHPSNSDVLLAATGNASYGENSGIYLSTNGGRSWERTLAGGRPGAVEFAGSNPNIAYAAGPDSFHRSEDGGRTWRRVAGARMSEHLAWGPPGILVGQPVDLQVDPRNADRVFMNSYGGGVFLSEDGGRSWVSASKGYTGANLSDIAIDPNDPQRLYAVSRSGGFRSDDGGGDWRGIRYKAENLDQVLPVGDGLMEFNGIAADPRDGSRVLMADEFAGTIYLSQDAGQHWTLTMLHPFANGDVLGRAMGFKAIAFAPSNPNIIYAGGCIERYLLDLGRRDPSFGIYRSADGGKTWQAANDAGTAQLNIHALAVDPTDPDIVYAGTLTAGVLRTSNGGKTWQGYNFGLRILDVRSVAVDPRNRSILYAGTQGGGLYKSTDAGLHWQSSGAGMDPQASVRDIVIDGVDSNIVYAGDLHSGVYRSENAGQLWVQLNKGLSTRAVKALALSSDGGTLYAATEGEGVFRLDLKPRVEGTVTSVSAASFLPAAPVAPESIASAWGQGFAASVQSAASLPLPEVLGETSLVVTDSAGVDRAAPLFFVSPQQVNFLLPAGTAAGTATIRVFRQNRVVARGTVRIESVAPGLFTADASGSGLPAAVAVRYPGGVQLPPLATPIDLGAVTDEVFLLLFGTGIRGGTAAAVRIGGVDAPVTYSGPQGGYAGLDQVNVKLPRALAGRGEVDLVLTVDGKAANTIRVRIK